MKKSAMRRYHPRAVGTGLLFLCVLLLMPFQVMAENIEIDPMEMDYGNAWVGGSVSEVFVLESMGPTPLMISAVNITDDATGSFSSAFLLAGGVAFLGALGSWAVRSST